MTSPLPNSEDAQLDEILDRIFPTHASMVVNFPTKEEAKQALKQLIVQRELDARIESLKHVLDDKPLTTSDLPVRLWEERIQLTIDNLIAQKDKAHE